MATTWVIGVDGSDNSKRALDWAVSQAEGRDVRLIAVSTWSIPVATSGALPGTVVFPDWSEVEADMLRNTQEITRAAERSGVAIEARVIEGRAAQTLIDLSADAEMLVVGGRGLGRLKGLLLGSVSLQCATHARVPTVVVAPTADVDAASRIVIGFDGSDEARAAVRWTLEFARPDASITIVDALPLAPWLSPADIRERFPDEVATGAAEFAEHMAELDPEGRATHELVLADPRLALSKAGAGADLMVVGARGRGGVGAALLGSVSTWMLHNASCATVIIPGPEASERR